MLSTSSSGSSFDLLDPGSVNWREALEHACSSLDGVSAAYLPIVSLKERAVRGYELLARFPVGPPAPPAMWFKSAAELGLTGLLETRIMRLGLTTAETLPTGAFLSINVTAEALMSDHIQQLFQQRQRYENVILEVSEKDSQEPGVADALTAFRAGGGRLALDDIGAGFSNLRDVMALKPEIVKVDRAVIRGIERDKVRSAIVEGLNRMTSRLEVQLLAEGIERRQELEELERLEVPLGQGYLFGEPGPIA